MNNSKRKRITIKLKTPNPLFEKWIIEFRDRAKEEESKMQFVFNNALKSLRKYPVPLERGKDCMILKGFGPKICQMLDDKLKQLKDEQDNDHLNDTLIGYVHIDKECDEKNKRVRRNISARSLLDKEKGPGSDAVLCDLPCKENVPRQQTFSSGYISDSSCTHLTESVDYKDAKICQADQPAACEIKNKAIQKHSSSSSAISSQNTDIILAPNTFDIILYVDTCETGGNKIDIHDDPILSKLRLLPVNYEVKSLKVGDYLWICRDKITKQELVLPYIIERKRLDDFAQSIKDGRYHEQKFRLKKSGIQNVIYLIEKYGHGQYVGLPLTTLYQAATNTAIQDGFCIKFTENYQHTAKYLANFSLLMMKMFKSKTIISCNKENLTDISLCDDLISLMTMETFNISSIKNKPLKVSDLFIKMLIQIKGMSVDRALAIVREFPTPATLREAYEQNPGVKGEKLLAPIQFGDYKKTIGIILSKTVYQLFTSQTF